MQYSFPRYLLILFSALIGAWSCAAHATLPAPTAPTSYACRVLGPTVLAANPAAASPMGILTVSGQLALLLETDAISPAVDLYIAAQLPDQSIWLLASTGQWLSYPAQVPAFRTLQTAALALNTAAQNLFMAPLAGLPPGTYKVYTVIVPAGTNPITFQWASSPYYLWCFTQVLPILAPAPVTPPPAPTVSFSANPTTVVSGGSSTLTWSSTNATGCTASDAWSGAKPLSGSESTGALTVTSSFTLSCTGAGGTASQSTTVTVSSPPPPAPAPPPPTGNGMPEGIPAIGAWYEATPVVVTTIVSGTETAPALYSRAGMPEIVGTYKVACSYCIVENAKVRGNVSLLGDHIVFRNSEVYGYMPGGNGTVVAAFGNDIVIRGNHIHNNGNMDLTVEHDVHGVSAGNGTKNVWVLENEIHHNSGDAIQVGHGHTPGATDGIYFGRNSCYADKENCVDFKIVSNTVVSENVMSNYTGGDAGGGGGVAIVLHYCAQNANIINNTVTNSVVGVQASSLLSDCPDSVRPVEARITGNTFDALSAYAVRQWDPGNRVFVEKNIISNTPVGIDLTNCAAGSTVIGNTFTNVPKPTVFAGAGCKPITSY